MNINEYEIKVISKHKKVDVSFINIFLVEFCFDWYYDVGADYTETF